MKCWSIGFSPRVGKLEVLVEVVEAIAEVGEGPSEEGQHVAVSEGAQELQEELAHALVEPVGLAAQHAERHLGESAQELLRVDLK